MAELLLLDNGYMYAMQGKDGLGRMARGRACGVHWRAWGVPLGPCPACTPVQWRACGPAGQGCRVLSRHPLESIGSNGVCWLTPLLV
jgi:hypothetical protein